MTHNKSMTDAEYIRELESENQMLRRALKYPYWKSADKDNTAFSARINCYQMDDINKALAHNWHDELKDMEAEG